jgi:hypothetical protein
MEKNLSTTKKHCNISAINLIAGCFFAAQIVTPIALATPRKKMDNKKR